MLIAILGRQPRIGLAELESLYGAENVRPIGDVAAAVNIGSLDQSRLGGTIKVASTLAEAHTTNWPELIALATRELPKLIEETADGKLRLGISAYGLNVGAKQLFAGGLQLKKTCRATGRSARVIPNTEASLNSAQVLNNKLTGDPLGMELVFIRDGNKTLLTRTVSVQDIDAYARRDHGRPMRDARVGMLPPKLAQTIINLAVGQRSVKTLLDPFCGTGVIMQEAALMGYEIYGTDIEPRMIDFTKGNLQVVLGQHTGKFEVGDATAHTWQPKPDAVATEAYLGRPLTSLPEPEKLREIIGDCNTIIEKFLKNIRRQLPRGARLCLAIPAWNTKNGFKHLTLLDHLESMGYNRVKFKHASWSDLIYHREDQVVARELLVLTVKD